MPLKSLHGNAFVHKQDFPNTAPSIQGIFKFFKKIRKCNKLPQLRKEVLAPSVVKLKIAFLDTNEISLPGQNNNRK